MQQNKLLNIIKFYGLEKNNYRSKEIIEVDD